MTREEIFAFVKEEFNTYPEYLWLKYPDYAVLRNDSGKWYAVIMNIPKSRLGIEESGNAEIINVKCDTMLIGSLLGEKGIFKGYHMNKKYWISILLDGTVCDDDIKRFISISRKLTSCK